MNTTTLSAISVISALNIGIFGGYVPQESIIATHEMPLSNRYGNSFVNDVFKNNILLDLAYMDGSVSTAAPINWAEVNKPVHYTFTLNPQETFVFHDDVLPEYTGKVAKSTNAHFMYSEGFKSDGYLAGDGVCHLASLLYWTAKDAGLYAKAPTSHDFATIPDIPREYGVSIYNDGVHGSKNALQNLYVTNNKDKPVRFVFDYENNMLKVSILEPAS